MGFVSVADKKFGFLSEINEIYLFSIFRWVLTKLSGEIYLKTG